MFRWGSSLTVTEIAVDGQFLKQMPNGVQLASFQQLMTAVADACDMPLVDPVWETRRAELHHARPTKGFSAAKCFSIWRIASRHSPFFLKSTSGKASSNASTSWFRSLVDGS